MRWQWVFWLLTLSLVLWALEGRAQQVRPANSFLTGASPRDIKFTPINPSKAMRTPDLTNVFRKPATQKPFGLDHVFPKISLGTWPPRLPNVSILQGINPFQPTPPKGRNPFNPPPKQ